MRPDKALGVRPPALCLHLLQSPRLAFPSGMVLFLLQVEPAVCFGDELGGRVPALGERETDADRYSVAGGVSFACGLDLALDREFEVFWAFLGNEERGQQELVAAPTRGEAVVAVYGTP